MRRGRPADRILKTVFTVLLLCTFLLASCARVSDGGERGGEDGNTASVSEDGSEPASGETDEAIEHLVMSFLVDDRHPLPDLAEVSAALNVLTQKEIGVEVELLPLSYEDIRARLPIWLSDQEQVDLLFVRNDDIKACLGGRILQSLDEYMTENNPDAAALSALPEAFTAGTTYRGLCYGISNADDTGIYSRGIVIPKRLLQEAGFSYDPKTVYTLDEVHDLFLKLKKIYPDRYIFSEINETIYASATEYFMSSFYQSSSEEHIGVDYNPDRKRYFNRFASSFYKGYLEESRLWYREGILYPNALLTEFSSKELARAGVVLAYFANASPAVLSDSGFSEETVILRMTDVYRDPLQTGAGYWTVPSVAASPEAAVRFLNLMYSDSRIMNLLSYGIEGKHYTLSNAEKGLIETIRGENGAPLYENPLPVYGILDQAYRPMSEALFGEYQAWKESAVLLENQQTDPGWDPALYADEISAVREVIALYAPVLESGSVDIDTYYSRFMRELREAGMSTIVAAKNAALGE